MEVLRGDPLEAKDFVGSYGHLVVPVVGDYPVRGLRLIGQADYRRKAHNRSILFLDTLKAEEMGMPKARRNEGFGGTDKACAVGGKSKDGRSCAKEDERYAFAAVDNCTRSAGALSQRRRHALNAQ